ncbi:MAG: Do family serine endopeptidase [Planctomycetota bacterium]|jgi:C-terminal processing protease CtpA/Prc
MNMRAVPILLTALVCSGCAYPLKLPRELAPLADMEQPLALSEPPQDEELRRQLPAGGFTGVYVGDARTSLDDLTAEPDGVLVTKVVENSPGEAAGIVEGDLLLWVARGEGLQPRQDLRWPSDWRLLELASSTGTTLRIGYDRAGVERETELREEKVGIVVRTATEVEARNVGLGPGGGAVIIGLARGSPWRTVGLRFEDLIVEANDQPVAHPQVLLDAIRNSKSAVAITYMRDGEHHTVQAPLSRRASETKEISIPLLFSYQKDRGVKETSILMGLFGLEETPVAWRCRLLWIITFTGGDADRLEETGS